MVPKFIFFVREVGFKGRARWKGEKEEEVKLCGKISEVG
jgi:hypothetical protein